MTEQALGVIETMGLVPAIEAADTGLKTADVTLDGLEMVGAGLVAIILRGDVSSVKAAVEAGTLAAQRLGRVISTTVIARTGEGLENIIISAVTDDTAAADPEPNTPDNRDTLLAPAPTEARTDYPQLEQLKLMSVIKLRAFVRTLAGYSMTREEIRSARKQDLIEHISAYYREKGVTHD